MILQSIANRLPRMWNWVLITIGLLVTIWVVAPAQLTVVLYKLSLVTVAAVVAYWVDRSLFAYVGRVDKTLPRDAFGAARLIVRGLIFLAVVLGVTLGL